MVTQGPQGIMMLRIGLLRRKPLEGAWGGVGAPRDP